MRLAILAAALATAGCGYLVDDADVLRTLEAHGFSDVRVTSRHEIAPEFFGCGKDDAAAFEAEATNASGRRVGVVVCAGWPFKGATVRVK